MAGGSDEYFVGGYTEAVDLGFRVGDLAAAEAGECFPEAGK